MAKQSGIHQLRGKVGEMSYYRQTGVEAGVVRGINQAMSQRVKTDEAFLNTRLNNREFGQAGRLASMLAQYINPKFRPMVLPFSQSKMAKVLLGYIKLDTSAPWGGRNILLSNSVEAQATALNAVAKNRFEDWGIQISMDEETTSVSFNPTSETEQRCAAIGAHGYKLVFLASTSWIGTYNSTDQKYAQSYARANRYVEDKEAADTDSLKISYTLRPAPPQGWPAYMAGRMGVVIILPYRKVNETEHILQEYCTYYAWGLQGASIS